MGGSNFQSTTATWADATTTNRLCTSNQVNCLDGTTQFFQLADVQLELGSNATTFEEWDPILLRQHLGQFNQKSIYAIGSGTANTAAQAIPITTACVQTGTTTVKGYAAFESIMCVSSPTLVVWDSALNSGKADWISTGGVSTSRTVSTSTTHLGFTISQTAALDYLCSFNYYAFADPGGYMLA